MFFLTTGLENIEGSRISLLQAKEARESGFLRDVIWMASDRGVEVMGGHFGARPPGMAQLVREVQAAGVRLIVSGAALQRLGIAPGKLDPKPDQIVPSGIVKLSELVSRGYEVIRY